MFFFCLIFKEIECYWRCFDPVSLDLFNFDSGKCYEKWTNLSFIRSANVIMISGNFLGFDRIRILFHSKNHEFSRRIRPVSRSCSTVSLTRSYKLPYSKSSLRTIFKSLCVGQWVHNCC